MIWGESRGAVGALIHGLLGGYKTLSIDPIVNRKFFIDEDDYHFQFDLTPISYVSRLNEYAAKTSADRDDIVILTHHDSTITFPYINTLDKKHFKILDLDYDLSVLKLTNPKAVHGFLIAKSVPVQLSIINQFLLSSNLIELANHQESDYYLEEFDSALPVVSSYFHHRYREHFIEIYRNDKQQIKTEWSSIESKLNKPLISGETYTLVIELVDIIPKKIKFLMWSDAMKQLFEIGKPKITKKMSRFGLKIFCFEYQFIADATYDKLYSSATFIEIGESLQIRKLRLTDKKD